MPITTNIRTIELGKSGCLVPVIGQGTMGFGGFFSRDDTSDSQWIKSMQAGIDAGLSFIDTAENYGAGHAEELVGRAVQGRRAHVTIATKFSPQHSGYSEVMAAAEQSLRRLHTDYIDLFQTHWPNPEISFEETMQGLQQLLNEGKIRWVGLSNTTPEQLIKMADDLGRDRFVSIQEQYNLADRSVEEALLPLCARHDLTLIAYSPLLEGKIAPGDIRKPRLAQMATRLGMTPAQVVLLWLLNRPNLIVIPKTTSGSHILENAYCGTKSLPQEMVEYLNSLYEPHILTVLPRDIAVESAGKRTVYLTIEEAKANKAEMVPSPTQIAELLKGGEYFKPIKVRETPNNSLRYTLVEGRLRYWAWVIAFGFDKPLRILVV